METSSDEFVLMNLDVDSFCHIDHHEGESESENGDYESGGGGKDHDDSQHGGASVGTGGTDELEKAMAEKESRQVAIAKKVAMTVLLLFAGAAAFATYTYSRRDLQVAFDTDFHVAADEIIGVARENELSTFGILRSLGNSFTSFSSSEKTNWPFVTIPNFQHRCHDFLELSGAQLIAFSPIVPPRESEQWSNYSVANQGWIEETLTTTFSYSRNNNRSSSSSSSNNLPPEPIRERIWKISEGTSNALPDLTLQKSLVPLWQMYPAPLDTSVVNYNLRSNVNFEKAIVLSESTGNTVLSQIFQKRELSVMNPSLDFDNDIPRSLVIQPVMESFEPQASVAGFLLVVLPWDIIFRKVSLLEGTPPVLCVVTSSCGSSFSYLIDGPRATFLGNQDYHDPKYDSMKEQSLFPDFDPGNLIGDSVTQYCEYSLSTYPTAEFEDVYRNSTPLLNMTVVLAVFALTSFLFLVYDQLVERLKRKVVKQAQRSNAIVNSLFPAEVQDRMFKAAEETRKSVSKAPKHMLQNFLSDADKQQQDGSDPSANPIPGQAYKTKPIADLFLECTVMFADISGFTVWSSIREPSQVFALLECIYNAFDATARKFKVFKVETIGDCYVAVCGLPDPNPNHAAVMARFAHKCLISMKSLVRDLEVTLGPGTSELAMRFGLHSGPVTAGVLRGEKSRFQLFGDTVNTTARMESSGERNRIHCSEATANCLIALGKGHWTRKREETIDVKGKGEMQTYWLRPKIANGASEKSDEDPESESGSGLFDPARPNRVSHRKSQDFGDSPKDMHAKNQRLMGWVSNMLLPLLEQVVDQREANRIVNQDFARLSKVELAAVAAECGCTKALEEVQEIVTLPHFDAKVAERNASAKKVQLSETVKKQLNALVGSLAGLYHDNPFHNFEHASHVTMSICKLLSRIVAPEVEGNEHDYDSLVHDHTYGITSDPLTQFAVVFSGLIHDVDHPGVPNATLVKEGAPVAVHYNNKSVAEQNSVDIAWNLLMEERFEELRDCIYQTEAELKRFRQLIVNSVMATDIVDKDLGSLRKARWAKAFNTEEQSPTTSSENDVNRKATIVIEHLIQASDVAHTMQHWQVYLRWNERFFQECYQAYLDGRAEKDPSEGWYQGEIGFYDFYIIPLAKKLKECGVFGVSSDEYLNYATQNREEWERRGKEVVEKFKAKHANRRASIVEA